MTKKKKKMTTIPKSQIPKTKNTERKALFKGRVNTQAIQDQDFYCYCYTHTHKHTHLHTHTIHPVIDPSCPHQLMCLFWVFAVDFLEDFVK